MFANQKISTLFSSTPTPGEIHNILYSQEPIYNIVDVKYNLNPKTNSDLERAKEVFKLIQDQYAVEGTALFSEYPRSQPKAFSVGHLWPFTGVVTAAEAIARASQDPADLQECQRLLTGFDAYTNNKKPLSYAASPVTNSRSDRYYDDNEWVGLAFVNAYRILNDQGYLVKAAEIYQWLATGWDEKLGGGIYWREGDYETKNTCSNGPAAVLALLLYQDTQQSGYLEWAKRILEWLDQLKDPQSGVYWDNIHRNGEIDKRTYTYNTGSVMHANALLYHISNDPIYLSEARHLAAASLEVFAKDRGNGVRTFQSDPWFNTVLLRGYVALYQVDPNKDKTYIEAYRNILNYAWDQARNPDGTFQRKWSGLDAEGQSRRWLLDQAAVAESYALLSQYPS